MAVREKKQSGTKIRGAGVVKLVEEYQQVLKMKQMWTAKETAIKQRLDNIVDNQGEVDEKGHKWLELPEEVGGVARLCKQKRVSQVLNADVAEVLLKRLKLWKKCSKTVEVVDEDAVLALGFQKKIPEDVMNEIIEEKVSYALYFR